MNADAYEHLPPVLTDATAIVEGTDYEVEIGGAAALVIRNRAYQKLGDDLADAVAAWRRYADPVFHDEAQESALQLVWAVRRARDLADVVHALTQGSGTDERNMGVEEEEVT